MEIFMLNFIIQFNKFQPLSYFSVTLALGQINIDDVGIQIQFVKTVCDHMVKKNGCIKLCKPPSSHNNHYY